MSRRSDVSFGAIALLLLPAVFFSRSALADVSARIEFATETVVVVDRAQQSRTAQKGTELSEGETVLTNQGRAQLRFSDGGYYSLQPNTQFRIDEYRYAGNDDKDDRVFVTLLKGGLRAISGLIGKHNREAYRMSTAIATIGIRGTEYGIDVNGTLHGQVLRGAIEVCNGGGCLLVPAGQAFFANSPKLRPSLTHKRALLLPVDRVASAHAIPVRSDQTSGASTVSSGNGSPVAGKGQKIESGDTAQTDFVLKDPKSSSGVGMVSPSAESSTVTPGAPATPARSSTGTPSETAADVQADPSQQAVSARGANAANSGSNGAAATQVDASNQTVTPQGNGLQSAVTGSGPGQAANQQATSNGNGPAQVSGNQTGAIQQTIGVQTIGNSQGAAPVQPAGQGGTSQGPGSNGNQSDQSNDALSSAAQLLGGKAKKPKKSKGG